MCDYPGSVRDGRRWWRLMQEDDVKSTRENGKAQLSNSNLKQLQEWLTSIKVPCPYDGLLAVIADCLDHCANDYNMYIVIGTTMKGDSFTLNWKGDDAPGPVYAETMKTLSINCGDLL